MSRDRKLKKISDTVFEEIGSGLKWEKKFNLFRLPLKNIEIVNSHNVHELEGTFEDDFTDIVKTNVSTKIQIVGVLDLDQIKDIYHIEYGDEDDKGRGIYSIAPYNSKDFALSTMYEDVEVRLSPCTSSTLIKNEGGKNFPFPFHPEARDYCKRIQVESSYYYGHYGEGCFSLSIPEEHFYSLSKILKDDENTSVELGVRIFSLSWPSLAHSEVVMPEDWEYCFLEHISVASKVGKHIATPNYFEEIIQLNEEEREQPERTPYEEILPVLLSLSKHMERIVVAFVVLIVVIIVYMILSQ